MAASLSSPTMRIPILLETAPRRAFACAADWPGWCRAGRDEALAIEALLAAAPRYAAVPREVGLPFEAVTDRAASVTDQALGPGAAWAYVQVVERLPGGSGTEFGVPSAIGESDRRPVDEAEAPRLAALVAAAWQVFGRVAAAAPEELRKGPRGGGRARSKIVRHVAEADAAYARELGLRLRPPAPDDDAGLEAMRAVMLDVLRRPSDGSPLADRRWTARYAARRIAWHALDHAWEIEDRTET